MTIRFLIPSSSGERSGNAVTASRWKGFFEEVGHRVEVGGHGPCDAVVAFNAFKTRGEALEALAQSATPRLVICLTGTDLYEDLPRFPDALDVLELADRLVVLHPLAVSELPERFLPKARVICQSAVPTPRLEGSGDGEFPVCVIAHLRDVKDPLRAAKAARLLPQSSRIRIVHVGKALTPDHEEAASREAEENPRYRWLGELSGERTATVLGQSRLLVLSSVLEGGANVLSEAVVAGVPVLASDIPCARGLLGDDYPGLFPVGDTRGLADLLGRAEADPAYYAELAARCRSVSWKFDPEREIDALRSLLEDLRRAE